MRKNQGTLNLGLATPRHPLAGRRQKPYGTPIWEFKHDDELQTLVGIGWSDAQIAVALGRSEGAVAQRRSSLGLTAPRRFHRAGEWTAAMDDRLTRMFDGGSSDAAIGRSFSKSAAAIRSRRQTLGLRRAP